MPNDVYFYPWIGKGYGNSTEFDGIRILLVGISHYEWCDKCWCEKNKRSNDLTCRIIAERAIADRSGANLQHWRKIENALLGKNADPARRQEVWDSLAYYNFIQDIVGNKPGIPPTSEMCKRAQPGLLSVIKAIEPHLVIALGSPVWHGLPPEDGTEQTLHANTKSLERRWYSFTSTRKITACRVPHPSARPGLGATWQPVLTAAIDAVRSQK